MKQRSSDIDSCVRGESSIDTPRAQHSTDILGVLKTLGLTSCTHVIIQNLGETLNEMVDRCSSLDIGDSDMPWLWNFI